MDTRRWMGLLTSLGLAAGLSHAGASERPYFVTYDQHMEEPGRFEIAFNPVIGRPAGGNTFTAAWLEFEYGIAGWWTAELYLDGQYTQHESASFTGWRFENRFRLLDGDRAVNPVFYVEYEDVDEADKTLKEIVGFDAQDELAEPVAETREEQERELELKLILGSDVRGWNLSENFIAVKNLHGGESWEFGYAIGASRPLALAATPAECRFCPENFRAGVEMYGGLGEQGNITFRGTSQYLAPVVSWDAGDGVTLRVSPAFGLTGASVDFLFRVGIAFEFPAVGPSIRGGR